MRDAGASGASSGPRLGPGAVLLLVAATFGGGMAMIVPMAYSLAVRVDELAPGRADVLGYILGIGSAATLVAAPLTGILSDRTRTRWGRRKPFTIAGSVMGTAAAPVMVLAPDLLVLTIGWVLSAVGWATATGSIANYQADRLAPDQRGKVSGMTGLTMHIAPVIGILAVGLVSGSTAWLFAIPAGVGALMIALFVALAPEEDSRAIVPPAPLSFARVVRSYGFRPSEVPDFAWNWLGRFILFLGLTLTTSFTTFFYAQRLGVEVVEVAGFMALTSALSIFTALVGSIGIGSLSDRLGARRAFLFLAAATFAIGCGLSAFAESFGWLLTGTLVTSLGIAAFNAVGQAIVLDVLPHRETQAGRYMAINLFAQKIPGALAPLAAPLLLGLGGGQNFVVLYLVAGALALLGGAIIAAKVHGVR